MIFLFPLKTLFKFCNKNYFINKYIFRFRNKKYFYRDICKIHWYDFKEQHYDNNNGAGDISENIINEKIRTLNFISCFGYALPADHLLKTRLMSEGKLSVLSYGYINPWKCEKLEEEIIEWKFICGNFYMYDRKNKMRR